MDKLAILGGKKRVTVPPPHYVWPEISEGDIKAVEEYMRNGKVGEYATPEVVVELEKRFREYHGVQFSLALNSCTSCLHTAYYALGIGAGDEVIAPTFTFPATATPVFALGGTPVLVDCLKDTANIDPAKIEKKITKKTKAIAITHLWGHPCEMDEIMAIAKKYNIPILEDCAHSPGAKYKGQLVGTFGDVACFSFDNNKLLASGEAGILITNSRKIFEKSNIFSDVGGRIYFQLELPEFSKFKQTGIGLKYRIHPLAGVIANEKFKRLKKLNEERVSTLNYFTNRLEKSQSIIAPITKEYVERGGYYGYKPIYDSTALGRLNIKKFIKILQAEGVDIRQTVSPPLHKTELFSNSENFGISSNSSKSSDTPCPSQEDFSVSEWFMENHVSFPTFSKPSDKFLIDEYVDAIIKVEKNILENPDQINTI